MNKWTFIPLRGGASITKHPQTANFKEERRGDLMSTKIDNNVYDYYLNTYGDTLRPSKFDTHKRSELKDTYNKIVRSNKNSPLVKINTSAEDLKKFAIDIKEQARNTQNVISAMGKDGKGMESVFSKKIAQSSDPSAVEVTYVGEDDDGTTDDSKHEGTSMNNGSHGQGQDGQNGANGGSENGSEGRQKAKGFKIAVKQLAKPQINTGNYMRSDAQDFESGEFNFDLYTPSNSYEFQLNLKGDEKNIEVQQKIARLVNTSDVGLTARVLQNDKGMSALQLTSKQTGLAEGEEFLFNLQSRSSWNELNRLGINNITENASNSSFTLNGEEHSSLSNSFTINKEFEINLITPTKNGEEVTVGFKTNTDAVSDSVQQIIDSFNGMLEVGRKFLPGHNNNKLVNEVNAIATTVGPELKELGVEVDNNGYLVLDRDRMAESLVPGKTEETFRTLDKFKNMVSRQAEKIAINPINYTDGLVVEYKNPGKTFTAPYAQSAYAGLIMDRTL